MKHMYFLLALLILFVGCEPSTGYTTPEQDNIISLLTNGIWLRQSTDEANTVEVLDSWKFEKNGKGSNRIERFEDNVKVYDETFYFQWAFTTESMAVIYILRQQTGEEFWQILALTNSTMKVRASIKDPVLNPGIEYSEWTYTHKNKED
ncbi:hypothetical protein [Bacteroides acidifaciens]|uniref:hypothetical protein n=2 Tax=Bacteroidales TaxID=171549 RepID=UPI000F47E30B|nr:hypothetical protein [Bacteroides acidifaciens]ROS87261.1 hypothetical protein EEL39_10940 [Muribaculaceae bacterium Isolate-080 (Janvier)]